MTTILVTGFEPFDKETQNPSLAVIRQLTNSGRPGILTAELPVDRFAAVDLILREIHASSPDAVIMLGEAGGRFRVTPERIAINVDDYRIPDNAGQKPRDEPITVGAPAAYFSTLPIRSITTALLEARIPAVVSNSAGTYLCNRVFYSVMNDIASGGLRSIAGFIHLPYMHEQALDKYPDAPSFSLDTLIRAVEIAVDETRRALESR